MNLELAENNGYGGLPESALAQNNANRESPYLFVPGGMIPEIPEDTYVNEKEFDDLPDVQWHTLMSMLDPYQENQMGIWPFSTKKSRARRKTRKDERQARKIQKITTRGQLRIERKGVAGIGSGILQTVGNIFAREPALPTYYEPPPPPPPPKKKTWIEKNWMLIAGIGVVGLIAIPMLTRGRRSRRGR